MRNIASLLLVALILSSCGSTAKKLQQGNYDAVIDKSVKKLLRKADAEDAAEMDRAYRLAVGRPATDEEQQMVAAGRRDFGRFVQQVQRWQGAGRQVLEQGLLFFFLRAFAGLAFGRHDLRLDLALGLALLTHGVGLANLHPLRLGATAGKPVEVIMACE